MYLPNCCGAVSLCSNCFTWTKVLTQDHYTCVQWYNKIWAIYTSFNKSQDSRSTKILMLRFQCNGWKEFRWSKFYRIVIYWHPSTMKALFYHITKAKFNEKNLWTAAIYVRQLFILYLLKVWTRSYHFLNAYSSQQVLFRPRYGFGKMNRPVQIFRSLCLNTDLFPLIWPLCPRSVLGGWWFHWRLRPLRSLRPLYNLTFP